MQFFMTKQEVLEIVGHSKEDACKVLRVKPSAFGSIPSDELFAVTGSEFVSYSDAVGFTVIFDTEEPGFSRVYPIAIPR